jgi:hypothetical protein
MTIQNWAATSALLALAGCPSAEASTRDGGDLWLDTDAGTIAFAKSWLASDPWGRVARGEDPVTLGGLPSGCGVTDIRELALDKAPATGRWIYTFRCPRADGGAP